MKRLFLLNAAAIGLGISTMLAACSSMRTSMAHQVHGGIRYTLHEDTRFSRVEKGKSGSLMYDSPELTMSCENGRMRINGVDSGPVKQGDHVEVTDTQIVLVNGEHRGDMTTGSAENLERLRQSKLEALPRSQLPH